MRWVTLAGISILCLGLTGRAVADPIVIQSGSAIVIAPTDSAVLLEAPDFRLFAKNFAQPATPEAKVACTGAGFPECAPGQTVSLAIGALGSDLGAVVTLNGQTFLVGLGSETTGSGFVSFDGTLTVPAFTGKTSVTVRTPFSFNGHVAPPDGSPNPAGAVLTGNGTTLVNLRWMGADGGWAFQRASYVFGNSQPIPEPTTLLLIGPSVLAGLVSTRRRRTVRA